MTNHNPPRIAPRHLFDSAAGNEDIVHSDKYKLSRRLTAINVTNTVPLYNRRGKAVPRQGRVSGHIHAV